MSSVIFANVKRRRGAALVKKFVRDLESGLFTTPKSFDAFTRYRTEQLKLDRRGDLVQVSYPENPLILGFYRKYPQAKTVPISLSSFSPPLAKVFALRQLQHMHDSKLDAPTAFALVEKEMAPQLQALTLQALGTNVPPLKMVQQEEERQLREAAVAMTEGAMPVEP